MAAAEDMGIAIMDEHIDQLMPVYTNFAAQLFSPENPQFPLAFLEFVFLANHESQERTLFPFTFLCLTIFLKQLFLQNETISIFWIFVRTLKQS